MVDIFHIGDVYMIDQDEHELEDYLPEEELDQDYMDEEERVQFEKDCARGVYPGYNDIAN